MSILFTTQTSEKVTTLTLDDGKANVLSPTMIGHLERALEQAEATGKALVLSGREGMFSAGFDLQIFKQGGQPLIDMLEAGARLAQKLLTYPHPTVVACTGHAMAMGLFLVQACDVRMGAAGAPFKYAINEVQIGLTLPYFAIEMCRMRLTRSRFQLATLTAEPHSPEEALRAGMLDELVDPEQLLPLAQKRAEALASLPREAYSATKQRLRAETARALTQALEADLPEWRASLLGR